MSDVPKDLIWQCDKCGEYPFEPFRQRLIGRGCCCGGQFQRISPSGVKSQLTAALARAERAESTLRHIAHTYCGVTIGEETNTTLEDVPAFVEGQIDKQSDRADSEAKRFQKLVEELELIEFNEDGQIVWEHLRGKIDDAKSNLHAEIEADALTASKDRIAQLEKVLREMLDRYTSLVNSGDAGNWNPEEDLPVKQARKALAP